MDSLHLFTLIYECWTLCSCSCQFYIILCQRFQSLFTQYMFPKFRYMIHSCLSNTLRMEKFVKYSFRRCVNTFRTEIIIKFNVFSLWALSGIATTHHFINSMLNIQHYSMSMLIAHAIVDFFFYYFPIEQGMKKGKWYREENSVKWFRLWNLRHWFQYI